MSGRIAAGTMMVLALAGPAWSQIPAGPDFGVNTYTTDIQQNPVVAADEAGNFIVVWEGFGSQDGNFGGVFGRRYDAAGTPVDGVEFQVNVYAPLNQLFPSVAVGDGRIVVVWASNGQDGSDWGIFGRRFDALSGVGGAEFPVNTYATGRQWRPTVALDGGGNFVVVWDSVQDGAGYGVFGRRYDASGAAQGGEFAVNASTAGDQQRPRVAMRSDGVFVVVWESAGQDGNGAGIFGQRFDATGTPAGPEFQVNAYTSGDQSRPSIAPDAGDGFVVVWDSAGQDGSSFGVFGRRFDVAGAPQGQEFQVTSHTTSYQRYPVVSSSPGGEFVVVWNSLAQDGSSWGVFGRRYDRLGAQGPEFRLNDYTTDPQRVPVVATADNGDFVASWGGFGPHDLAPGGVFGRRFSPEVIFRDGFDAP
jgi:hypothetical protein